MSSDPASLENLRDIVVPSPVSWWPPAVGWWLLAGALCIAGAVVLVGLLRQRRHNAYRRIALRELAAASALPQVAEILKRTALVAGPRNEIAGLSGERWCRWLRRETGKPVPESVQKCLGRDVFRDEDSCDLNRVKAFVAEWIERHRRHGEPDGKPPRRQLHGATSSESTRRGMNHANLGL
jgi:hypothetical protein